MTPDRNPAVAVTGAGGVGFYYGGMLAMAGVPVTLIGRTPHIDAVRRNGLVIEREARQSRALAGEDLVRRCRAGLLKDHGHVSDLLALTILLTEDNPLWAAA